MKYIACKRQGKRRGEGARDFLCYWTVVELGMPMVDLARKFDTCRYQLWGSTRRENRQGTGLSIGEVRYLSTSGRPSHGHEMRLLNF